MPVNLSTVQKWIEDVDSLGEWLRYDESGGKVNRIFCALFSKHQDRLREVRNFSSAFVDGITETALKKDNVCKHQRSDMHGKAVNMEWQPTINEIYSSTPLWRAFASANLEEINRVSKLFLNRFHACLRLRADEERTPTHCSIIIDLSLNFC